MSSIEAYWEKYLLKGDEKSFSAIYNQMANDLYGYGLSFGYREEICKDALQDVFYRLFIQRDKLHHVENIIAYLFRSYRNRLADLTRMDRRTESIGILEETFSPEVTILDDLIDQEVSENIRQKIENLLRQLNANQREIVYLKYMSGLQHREIAGIMGIQEESARKLLYRAIEKMRKSATGDATVKTIILTLLQMLQ